MLQLKYIRTLLLNAWQRLLRLLLHHALGLIKVNALLRLLILSIFAHMTNVLVVKILHLFCVYLSWLCLVPPIAFGP